MTMQVSGTSGFTFPDNTTQATAAKVGMTNRIINGAMMIDQRNSGASVTPTAGQFVTDRFRFGLSQASKLTAQQSTTAPAGFINSLLVTSSSAYSVVAGDYFSITHPIEGLNVADFGWGTANAATVTLSFWVRSSLTGTFGGTVQNSASNRSYPFSYTISAANTWEQKSITIAGDTTGTWLTTNGSGIVLRFALGYGSTYGGGTAGAWVGSDVQSVTGATSVVGTSGATFYITGVQLEKGSTATSFDYRPYGTELVLCQRYFFKITGGGRHAIAGNGSLATSFPTISFPQEMRTTPTFSYSSLSHFNSEAIAGAGQATVTGISLNANTSITGTVFVSTAGSSTNTGAQLLGNNGGGNSWTAYSSEL